MQQNGAQALELAPHGDTPGRGPGGHPVQEQDPSLVCNHGYTLAESHGGAQVTMCGEPGLFSGKMPDATGRDQSNRTNQEEPSHV
jgi:hypothetical protein